MNPFFNVWVLGQDRWRHMAKMLLVADRVTVWGASFQQIMDANANHGFPYTPSQFLTLIDEGFIRYAAREPWYDPVARKEFTNPNFVMSEWEDSFDLELKKRIATGRTVALPRYDVQPWVSQQVDQQSSAFQNAVSHSRRLPETFRGVEQQRLGEVFRNTEILVKRILDFGRNHHLASEALDCDTVVETAESPLFFQEIGGSPNPRKVNFDDSRIQLEDLLYNMSRAHYVGGDDTANFSKHLNHLHALKDYGSKSLLAQKSFKYLDVENDILRSLLRKIIAVDETWSQAEEAGLLIPGLVLTAKEVIDQVKSTAAGRRGFLKSTFRGGLATLTAAKGAGEYREALKTIREEPVVQLNEVERAFSILMRDSQVSSSVPVTIAKELHNELLRAKLPLSD